MQPFKSSVQLRIVLESSHDVPALGHSLLQMHAGPASPVMAQIR